MDTGVNMAGYYLWTECKNMCRVLRNGKSDYPISAMVVLILAFSFVCPSAPAYGQSVGEKWEFTITPYLFFSGVDGDVTVRGRESSVDADFSNYIRRLGFWRTVAS